MSFLIIAVPILTLCMKKDRCSFQFFAFWGEIVYSTIMVLHIHILIFGAIFHILITWSLVSGFPCLLLWQRAMYVVNKFLLLFVRGNT